MRVLVKRLVLTLLAVGTIMLTGASGASAGPTSLCTADIGVCPEANQVKHVHEVDSALTIRTPILTLKCVALVLGDVFGTWLDSPLEIIVNFTYSGCKEAEGGSCETKEIFSSSWLLILRFAPERAETTLETSFLVKCGSFLHCVYSGPTLSGATTGPLAIGGVGATQFSNAGLKVVGGFLCPSGSTLTTTLKPLTSTYVSS